ncbi:hypothetical protein B7P43_G11160 [Cryptotermes secundus]|uniref:Mos1 transposase HTH domain-containing protein n=1 Tax=Cryptotermes secundus TaxID=105785 RepID=A0A2J7R7I4_9NEOP|nr:hypothetical protein B7P43_G11160 [Cryptotermes secundus]
MTEQHEQRYCIKFCQKLGDTQVETIHKIQQAFRDDAMSNSWIKEWYNRLKDGRTSVDSEPRSGRPSTSRNENFIEQVRTLVMEDRRITFRELANEIGVSNGSVHSILTEDLGMRSVSTKFVPKLLTMEQKQRHLEIVQDMLDNANNNARPHTVKTTIETLRKLKWNLLTHLPYSPDLAPSDFYLFGRLKSDLQGMRFVDNDAVIQNVREWIHRQPQNFFEKVIRMLPECWKKCVDSGGEYVED